VRHWDAIFSVAAFAVGGAMTGCDSSNGGAKPATSPAPTSTTSASPPPSDAGDANEVEASKPPATDSDAPIGPADCAALANEVCSALDRCASYLLQADYGNIASCSEQYRAACTEALRDERRLDVVQCRSAIAANGCEGFRGASFPVACLRPLGSTEAGAPCGRHADCATGYCARKGECGTCVSRAASGHPCESSEACQLGLVCHAASCTLPLESGAPCAGQVCGLHGWCVQGVCAALGRDGATCDAERPCDSPAGYACVAGVCQALSFVDLGAVCGVTSNQPRCSGGNACVAEQALGERKCVAQPGLGAPCPDGRCRPPYTCADGICGVLDVSFCK